MEIVAIGRSKSRDARFLLRRDLAGFIPVLGRVARRRGGCRRAGWRDARRRSNDFWCYKTEREKQHAQDQIQPHRRQISCPPLREVFLRKLARLEQQDVQGLPESAVNMSRDVPGVLEKRRDGTRALVPMLTTVEAIRSHQGCAAIAALRVDRNRQCLLIQTPPPFDGRSPRVRHSDQSIGRIRRNIQRRRN